MPKEVEDKLKARATAKGFKGKRWRRYVYGTMQERGLLERDPFISRLVELAAKIDLGNRNDNYGSPICGPGKRLIYYPTIYVSGKEQPIDLPEKGKATIEYRVRNRSMNKNEGDKERHSVDIEVHSIEPHDEEEKPPVEGEPAKLLHDLRKFIGFDNRPRDNMGQFVGDQTDGIDPNSMAAAYGPPAVTPVDPFTPSHIERIKRFFTGRRQKAGADTG
jgi:hypothetical protein